ncbi:hypothetical protein IKD67_04280 [Candidatus Saccharibacteria bacterium]|nr:hypothetical protein [Candidatus Saccharibacteria bacterium]
MARRRNNRKWIIGGVILALLIVVGVGTAIIWNNEHQETEQNNETEKTEDKKKDDTERHDGETEEEYSERMAEQKRIKQYEGEDPNKAEELTGVITYAGINEGVLMIRVNVDQFLSEGNCALSLMRNGDVIYSVDAKIIAEVSTSTCDGFSVPISGLGSGATDIVIKLSAGGKTGTIRGEVDI